MEIFNFLKVYIPTMKIPFLIFGVFFIFLGFYNFYKFFKNQNDWGTRNAFAASILQIIFGISFLLCNGIYFLISLIAWIFLTVIFAIFEKRNFIKNGKEIQKKYNRVIPWFAFKSKGRIIADACLIILMLTVIFPYFGSGYVYQMAFGQRYETNRYFNFKLSDFPGLICDKYYFKSNKNLNLAGFLYYREPYFEKRGLVVFAHGYGGGGHISYLSAMDYFAKNGFYVFAYDATGHDNSEGEYMFGLPQQIIDMDYAINFAKELPEAEDLPIYIFGHSWGGYTVTNELAFHPEIKGACCISGFNYSMDLIKSWGPKMVGKVATAYFVPYIALHQKMICGKLSEIHAQDALEKTSAKVFFITAPNDTIVPPEYGFYLWKDKFNEDKRFKFVSIDGLTEDEAHNYVFVSKEYREFRNYFNDVINSWRESLDYDYNDSKNNDRYIREYETLKKQHDVDKHRANQIDKKLFDEIVDFWVN